MDEGDRMNEQTQCRFDYAGYGLCVLDRGHDGEHRDVFGHPFTPGEQMYLTWVRHEASVPTRIGIIPASEAWDLARGFAIYGTGAVYVEPVFLVAGEEGFFDAVA
jgi:hypothetical protein